jgi:hypothetical protein
MKSHFYHPARVKEKGSPVIINNAFYEVMIYFLDLLEKLVPDILTDLEDFTNNYRVKESQGIVSNFDQIPRQWSELIGNDTPSNQYVVELISSWAKKYSLENIFYKELALWSVGYYYDDIDDLNRKKRIEDMNHFIAKTGISESTYWQNRDHEIPYKERLSLKSSCYLEEDFDHIALQPEDENDRVERDFFGKYLPFTFTPDTLMLNLSKSPKDYQQYESLLQNQHYNQKHDDEKEQMSWSEIHGHGWDPRSSTWNDFEELMDAHFKAYKKMYRMRTEKWMKNQGYIKFKEKRNMDHFKWLIHYKIQGWSVRKIADNYSTELIVLNEDTISHGIKSASALMDLNLTV